MNAADAGRLRVVWLCNCGTHALVNPTTRVVDQHQTPELNYCRTSSCVISAESLRVYGRPGVCAVAHPDGPRCTLNAEHHTAGASAHYDARLSFSWRTA